MRLLLVAAFYFIVGRLSLLLAIPPGYATAVWPAAGIALASLLLYGYRVWPGIVLGSFLVNVATALDTRSSSELLLSLILPLGIGMGAALQAVVGAALVRRSPGFPNPLNHEQAVARLLLCAGPVSCLINATAGVSLMWATNQIQAGECAFNWWTWWVGDTIGVFMTAPLALLWLTPDQADWPRRPITVSIPMGILATLVVIVFFYTGAAEQQRIRFAFESQTETLTRAFENRVEHALEALNRLRNFTGSSPHAIDQHTFAKAAQTILTRRAPVQALSWNPRVTEAERVDFEKAARRVLGPDFAIRQRDAQGRYVPVAKREEYFPILYREPLPAIRQALGFDVASDPERLEALRQAADTAEAIATVPLLPVQQQIVEKTILVYLPIYRDGANLDQVAQRRQAVLGYMVAVLRVGQLLDLAWAGLRSEGIDFWLEEQTTPTTTRFVYHRSASTGEPAAATDADKPKPSAHGLQRSTTIQLAGRQLNLRFALTPEFLAEKRSLQAWSVLAGGMLFTGLLGAILLVITGRAALIATLVQERSGALARANSALVQEIAERQRAEDERRRSEEQSKQAHATLEESRRLIERIAAMMPSILYVYDLNERCNIFVNERIQSILGYAPAEMMGPGAAYSRDQFHPQDWSKVLSTYEQFLTAQDGAIIEMEYRMRHANGEWRWLHSRNTIFTRDAEGAPRQVLGTAQDVTERKRLEQEVLEIAANEQRRIGQELHDGTGQELTGLCMLTECLAEALRERAPTEAQRARRIAQGLQEALGRVRSLSRGLIPVEVDAEGLMVALAELAKQIDGLNLSRCVFNCQELVPVEDNYTATQLFRIAQEAVTNALKHGRAKLIRISLETKGRYLTLTISDDGVGMTAANHAHTGMGLHIMRYRASQIGAHFSVRSGAADGTVISCTIFRGALQD